MVMALVTTPQLRAIQPCSHLPAKGEGLIEWQHLPVWKFLGLRMTNSLPKILLLHHSYYTNGTPPSCYLHLYQRL